MSEYNLDDCSLYDKNIICNKPVYIFENHNMALPVWGTFANRNNYSYKLITFDYHTDSRPLFNKEIVNSDNYRYYSFGTSDTNLCHPCVKNILSNRCYMRNDFNFEDVFVIAHDGIDNCEHITAAYKFEYLYGYVIIYKKTHSNYEESDKIEGFNAKYYISDDFNKISSNIIESYSKENIILDFDLDYFNRKKDLSADFFLKIKPLILKADVITIAREKKYFIAERIDNRLSNNKTLEMLLKNIKFVLSSYL